MWVTELMASGRASNGKCSHTSEIVPLCMCHIWSFKWWGNAMLKGTHMPLHWCCQDIHDAAAEYVYVLYIHTYIHTYILTVNKLIAYWIELLTVSLYCPLLGRMIRRLKTVHSNSQYHLLKNIQTSHQLWDLCPRCFIQMVRTICHLHCGP